MVEQRLLKYIPKDLRQYVVWLDFEPSTHTYFLIFEKNGYEYSAENADSVKELTWNAKQTAKYLDSPECSDTLWR